MGPLEGRVRLLVAAFLSGRSTGGRRRMAPLPAVLSPDALNELTGVTGTNGARALRAAPSSAPAGVASAGAWLLTVLLSGAFGAGFTSIGLAGGGAGDTGCGDGATGRGAVGPAGFSGCDAAAGSAGLLAPAGQTVSQTTG
jgi:hypothetical protein